MSQDVTPSALSAEVEALLQDLKQRLRRPETVRLAVKQYVVSEVVGALIDVEDLGLTLTATSELTSDTENDDGTATSCHTESYSLLGHEVYSHTVCETVAASGGGSVSTTVTH